MKVILLENIGKIGRQYETKNVKSGYARNFLIPRNQAIPATEKNIAYYEKLKERSLEKEKMDEEFLNKSLNTLKDIKIEIEVSANEEGHLFSGIGKEDIKKLLEEKANISLPVDSFILDKPVKEVGEHNIKIEINEKRASFALVVKGGKK